MSQVNVARNTSRAVFKLVFYIVVYVAVAADIQWLFSAFLPVYRVNIADYLVYVQILLSLAFGYLIVSFVAELLYKILSVKYEHSAAAAVRNLLKIIGLGALAASIAGGVAGGAVGLALGGFIGLVIGFASQQILGQAIAGLFLLIARPFKIGDAVVIAGEEGVVEDIATLFTSVVKADVTKVLIPNNSLIGGKIVLKKAQWL